MSESVPLPRRVRLRFVVALMLVLPFLAHAVWDYVEARRLNQRIQDVVASGAPTSNERFRPMSAAAADADRFYRAAAALAGSSRVPALPAIDYQVAAALRSGNWPPDVAATAHAQIEALQEALSLTDRAAPLPFDGFSPGWTSVYLVSGLMRLARFCDLRAAERALAGDSNAALDSLYSEVQLARAIGRAPQMIGLPAILARTMPSPAARVRLTQALAAFDRDDRMALEFTRLRALMLDENRRVGSVPWISQPFMVHQVTRRLDTFAALIAAAQRPAAERHDALMAVGDWPSIFSMSPDMKRQVLSVQVRGTEHELASVHCARQLVAGEAVNCQP